MLVLKAIVAGMVLFHVNNQPIYLHQGESRAGITLSEVGPDWVKLADGRTFGLFRTFVDVPLSAKSTVENGNTLYKMNELNYGISASALASHDRRMCESFYTGTKVVDCIKRNRLSNDKHNAKVRNGDYK